VAEIAQDWIQTSSTRNLAGQSLNADAPTSSGQSDMVGQLSANSQASWRSLKFLAANSEPNSAPASGAMRHARTS